jgi:S-formylglutathione hydrolase FrmB
MPRRIALLIAFAVFASCCTAAVAADSALSATSAASAVSAKPAEPSRSHFENTPPQKLGEKLIEKPADGTVIEKFLVHSAAMNRNVHVAIVLPPAYAAEPTRRFPVLYTLHGSDGPYDMFSAMNPLRAALKTKPMLVVGFDGDGEGWYIDSPLHHDSQFETFFFKELIPHIEKNYRAIPETRARAVTGNSMGGYGAFHYMAVHPEMFASASSLSGAFNVKGYLAGLLGDPAKNKAAYDHADVYRGLEAALAQGVKLPPLLLTCGTEDHLLRESRDLSRWLTEKKIPFEYIEKPGGHSWPFWRDSSPAIIDFHWRTFQGNYQPMNQPVPASAQPAEGPK